MGLAGLVEAETVIMHDDNNNNNNYDDIIITLDRMGWYGLD
jgi:hypothetical protein